MRLSSLLIVGVLSLAASLACGESLNSYGPLYHRGDLTLEPGHRTEMVGPIAVYEERDSSQTWSLAPLFSFQRDPATDSKEFDLLYPLITYDQFGTDYRFQLLQLFSLSGGNTVNERQNRRFTIFPIYFQQRSTDPASSYTALVPFYGHLKNRLLRDEIDFVLFPLYAKTRKRDLVTRNYVYPVFHLRQGDGLRGWQFWPLIGREHKEPTTKTNQLGENQIVGGHEKEFVLWPFYVNTRAGIGTDNPQTQRALLPLFSIQRSTLRDSSTYLWPLGFTHTDDREKKYREWDAPWPLIVFARGEGKTVNRIWPLFSQAKSPTLQSDFYLWPLYKRNRVRSEPFERDRTRGLFFLYSDLVEKNTATGTALNRIDLWPLFTTRRDHAGNERLQIFAPLEPIWPNHKSIERNYARLWSVWRSEKSRKTGAASQSLLWNLYRSDSTPTSKRLSLCFGMLQYQSGPEGKRWRLLYIPLGKAKKSAPSQPSS